MGLYSDHPASLSLFICVNSQTHPGLTVQCLQVSPLVRISLVCPVTQFQVKDRCRIYFFTWTSCYLRLLSSHGNQGSWGCEPWLLASSHMHCPLCEGWAPAQHSAGCHEGRQRCLHFVSSASLLGTKLGTVLSTWDTHGKRWKIPACGASVLPEGDRHSTEGK